MMPEILANHKLSLTEEEAMGLLAIVMMSPVDLSADQKTALIKLSDFCRELLRESTESPSGTPDATRAAVYAA